MIAFIIDNWDTICRLSLLAVYFVIFGLACWPDDRTPTSHL